MLTSVQKFGRVNKRAYLCKRKQETTVSVTMMK